jgi:carbon monoxide dehydrogenase subunit G
VQPIQVSVDIGASPAEVWDYVEDISTHPEWMRDARAIRFTSPTTAGVGTTFDCDTKIGPFRLTDRMEVTEWVAGQAMGIRHAGIVTGQGRFSLEPTPAGTRFIWTEALRFPWWQGGAVAGFLSRPVLRRVWNGNLSRLRERVENR